MNPTKETTVLPRTPDQIEFRPDTIQRRSISWKLFEQTWGKWKQDYRDIVDVIQSGKGVEIRIWVDRRSEFFVFSVPIERKDPKLKKWLGKRRTAHKR